ncbi:MAG: hypothetical protein JWR89_2649 [Tardiphaga sp.]|jgi:hypothetical protein|nr:hypothetical protein [Tardiphaga sp.]
MPNLLLPALYVQRTLAAARSCWALLHLEHSTTAAAQTPRRFRASQSNKRAK